MWRQIKTLILSVLFCSRHRLCSQALDQRNTKQFRTITRRVSGTRTSTKRISNEHKFVHFKIDCHDNTIGTGSNCIILQYNIKECDLLPYRDDHKSVSNVLIVHAATAWQSTHTWHTYILVFNKALWMGNHMNHSWINPNQLRHYVIKVQDSSIFESALSIITEDNEFCMNPAMVVTVVYAETFTPSEQELHQCPYLILSSSHAWYP